MVDERPPSIRALAHRGSYRDFVTASEQWAEGALLVETTLILEAAANKNLEDRYSIIDFLLDRGADVSVRDEDQNTALHVLLGQVHNEVEAVTRVSRRLVEGGADVNALDRRHVLPVQYISNMKFGDDELAPIYDLWFDQPYLDLTTPNAWGFSPLDLARRVPFRAKLVGRMEARLSAQAD